jgi:hypothetical protein
MELTASPAVKAITQISRAGRWNKTVRCAIVDARGCGENEIP